MSFYGSHSFDPRSRPASTTSARRFQTQRLMIGAGKSSGGMFCLITAHSCCSSAPNLSAINYARTRHPQCTSNVKRRWFVRFTVFSILQSAPESTCNPKCTKDDCFDLFCTCLKTCSITTEYGSHDFHYTVAKELVDKLKDAPKK